MRLSAGFLGSVGLLLAGIPAGAQPNATSPANRAGASVANIATLAAKTERIAPNKIKLSITPKPEARADYKLLDAAGKEIAATIGGDGTVQATVDPKQAYVLSPPKANPRPLLLEGQHFPARYVTFNAAGATNLGGLFLRPARVPLTWDEATGKYSTDLFVGYEFQDGAEKELPSPKTVTFFTEGQNARIQADTVVVKKSGSSGYARVTLSTTDVTGETHFTARASPVDELKSSVAVLREPGALKIAVPSTELAAFGVGSGVLTVTLLARDGAPLAVEEPLEIQLSSRRLRLPASVKLGKGESSAEVGFRSAGYGQDSILAQSGALKSPTQNVRLIFPVAATVAALAGGALGGMARYLRNQRSPRKTKPLLARRVIEGVLVGVIFVGAAWAGLVTVNLSTGILGTPFGAFVLAALSGYVGCAVLDRVANRTFKGLKSEA